MKAIFTGACGSFCDTWPLLAHRRKSDRQIRFTEQQLRFASATSHRRVTVVLAIALSVTLLHRSSAAATWDTFSDTWVATDGLGRSLPTFEDVGCPKPNKQVGMYYFLWMQGGAVQDITQILASNPQTPSWGARHSYHHWGRPLLDYYRSDDRYVLRKHAQMLADAGVDALFIDVSNGYTYDTAQDALCEELDVLRRAGQKTPQLSFLLRNHEQRVLQHLYDTLYAPNVYPDLWFRWKGTNPLILARSRTVSDPLRAFFVFRESWAWTQPDGWFDKGYNKWPWLAHYPQAFGWHKSIERAEEISVCVAQHATHDPRFDPIGRSFHHNREPVEAQRNPSLGLCFAEQWSRALTVGAEMTFITGWNEWIAQRFVAGLDAHTYFLGAPTSEGQTYFVDQYSQEFSRDIEPMSGGHGDNYYYQLIANVRRLKGARPIEPVSAGPISVDRSFADWLPVSPEFRDHIGDPARRDHPGYDAAVTLVNDSGRNDLKVAKVSVDATSFYFYARTESQLTPPASNWMLLFIDADANASTGWLGYDFVVNRTGVSATSTVIERNLGGYSWGYAQTVPMQYSGKEIELAIPRTVLGPRSTLDFKWADNIRQTGDWSDFTLNGDVAPNDRFNYRAKFTVGAPANVIHVDAASSCPTPTGTQACPFKTFCQGYDSVAPRGTLRIQAGSYTVCGAVLDKCAVFESHGGSAILKRPVGAALAGAPGARENNRVLGPVSLTRGTKETLAVKVTCVPGEHYQVLSSTDLVTWELWYEFTADREIVEIPDVDGTRTAMRFFRLVQAGTRRAF